MRLTKKHNAHAAAEAVHFLREFADRTHRLKEEKILFPAIESRTFFPGCALMSEHKEGRELGRGMAEAVERCSRGAGGNVRPSRLSGSGRQARTFGEGLSLRPQTVLIDRAGVVLDPLMARKIDGQRDVLHDLWPVFVGIQGNLGEDLGLVGQVLT